MNVTPMAADSMGARSMATLVETPEATILIDPSVRLGPSRYELPPHPTEEERQRTLWRAIRQAASKAQILTVSHYHYDHHNPDAPSLFRSKVAFLKDGKAHINRSQRARAAAFAQRLKPYPKEVRVADGNRIDLGPTELAFSPAVPHGPDDELGYVVMARVTRGAETFVHTSDVLGLPLKSHLAFILDADPTLLYVDGPMTHLPEARTPSDLKRSVASLLLILRRTRIETLLLDHHSLRDREWRTYVAPVVAASEEHGVTLQTAAEFTGRPVDQLEANRDRLYGLGLGEGS